MANELDNIRMWASILDNPESIVNRCFYSCIINALKKQGLQYNPETKEIEEINKEGGKQDWYIAKKDFHDDNLDGNFGAPVFMEGERVTKEKVFGMIPYMTEALFAEYFYPSTPKENIGNDGVLYNTVSPEYRWYVCIKQINDYEVGKVYKLEPHNVICSLEYFRPATEDEMPKTDSFDKEGVMTFKDGSQAEIQEKKAECKPIFIEGDTIRLKDGDGRLWKIEKIREDGYTMIGHGLDETDFLFLDDKWEVVEQNPAWSEEDDSMVEDVRNSFEFHCDEMTEALQEQYNKFFDKVKSLRPQSQWKPSDEQMDALEDAIADAVSSIQKNMLNSLYSDLKKL